MILKIYTLGIPREIKTDVSSLILFTGVRRVEFNQRFIYCDFLFYLPSFYRVWGKSALFLAEMNKEKIGGFKLVQEADLSQMAVNIIINKMDIASMRFGETKILIFGENLEVKIFQEEEVRKFLTGIRKQGGVFNARFC